MDHPQVSRIVIDNEPAWLRVKSNLVQGMNGLMEARLSTLPGGSNGAAAKSLRKEVESRLAQVSLNIVQSDVSDPGRHVQLELSESPGQRLQL
jgi:hypothetical protein